MKILKTISLAVFLLFFFGCTKSKKEPYRVGFVAGISGKYSPLGVSVRNGALLAVKEINDNGGINKRELKLIIKDDKQDAKIDAKVLQELINAGIKVIIGNTTSSMSKVSIPIANKNKVLLLSPTASSDKFSAKDDCFLRITSGNSPAMFEPFVKMAKEKNFKKTLIVYDEKNMAYVKSWIRSYKEAFAKIQGKVEIIKFGIGLQKIKEKIRLFDPDIISVATNAVDAAMLIQSIRIANIDKLIFCSGWAKGQVLLTNGGKYVEGIYSTGGIDMNIKTQPMQEFKKRYYAFYHEKPNSFALRGYEAVQIIKKALEKNPNINELKKTILSIAHFDGVAGSIMFDKYGDVKRKVWIYVVKNGRFIKL